MWGPGIPFPDSLLQNTEHFTYLICLKKRNILCIILFFRETEYYYMILKMISIQEVLIQLVQACKYMLLLNVHSENSF